MSCKLYNWIIIIIFFTFIDCNLSCSRILPLTGSSFIIYKLIPVYYRLICGNEIWYGIRYSVQFILSLKLIYTCVRGGEGWRHSQPSPSPKLNPLLTWMNVYSFSAKFSKWIFGWIYAFWGPPNPKMKFLAVGDWVCDVQKQIIAEIPNLIVYICILCRSYLKLFMKCNIISAKFNNFLLSNWYKRGARFKPRLRLLM